MSAINPESHPCLPEASHGWTPAVIDGSAGTVVRDCDRNEIWYWFIARIRSRGNLAPDRARLVALLNWNDRGIEDAVHRARLEQERDFSPGAARNTHLEYLAADFLAQWALEPEQAQTAHDARLRVVSQERVA